MTDPDTEVLVHSTITSTIAVSSPPGTAVSAVSGCAIMVTHPVTASCSGTRDYTSNFTCQLHTVPTSLLPFSITCTPLLKYYFYAACMYITISAH